MTKKTKQAENQSNVDVLVVEDNEIDQKIIANYLEEYEVSYLIVNDGLKALEAIKKLEFKLVLLDLGLPVLNGYQLMEKLKKELKNNLSVVAITGHDLEEVKEKCFDLGFSAVFSKPIGKIELVGVITLFLPHKFD